MNVKSKKRKLYHSNNESISEIRVLRSEKTSDEEEGSKSSKGSHKLSNSNSLLNNSF